MINEILKRPLLFFVIIYCLGIIYSSFLTWASLSILITASIITIIIFIKYKHQVYILIGITIIVFAFSSVYSYYRLTLSNASLESYSNKEISFEAQIISEPDIRDKKVIYTILLKKAVYNEIIKNPNSKVLLTIYDFDSRSKLYSYGNLVKGIAKVKLPSQARNPGGFDYKRFLLAQNIYATLYSTSYDIHYAGQAKLNPLINLSLYLRNSIIKIIDSSLPPNEAGFLKGVVLGDRSGLAENIKENFNISGLTHILCVSGANIAYVAGACIFLFRLIKLGSLYSNLITIGVIILFTYITGSSPSTVRAAIMGIMILAAEIFERKSDVITSISIALIIILIYNPFTLYDISFQLSFAGTIGIVLFYKTFLKYFNFLPEIINKTLSITLSAQLTVSPIIAYYFNKISLISVFSNLIVVPITGLVTISGFFIGILGQFLILPTKLIAGINYFLISFILWIADISAKIPLATINVITPNFIFIILYYISLYIFLWYIPIKKPDIIFYKVLYISTAVIILIFITFSILPKPLEITFVDVGQGDCIFIKTPNGKICLIDGGGTYPGSLKNFDIGKTLIPFLFDNGITSVDLAILTHVHGDHIQGLIKVVESFSVKKLVIGPQFQFNSDLNNLLKLCKIKNVEIKQLSKGNLVELDKTKLYVLHPSTTNHFDNSSCLNNNSLVLKLIHQNTSILLTGDIEKEAEEEILNSEVDIKSDILKVPHHGSITSTSEKFLKAVSPKVCIISVGNNNFGHPSKSVINRINSTNAKLFRTDLQGAIKISIFKNKFKVRPTI